MIRYLLFFITVFSFINSFSQINVTIDTSICFNDSIYLEGEMRGSQGTFLDTLFCMAVACDTFITTNLSIDTPIIQDTTTVVLCEGDIYTFYDGSTIDTDGIFPDIFPNPLGCDTFLYVDILITSSDTVTQTRHRCSPTDYALPDGTIVHTTGIYPVTLFSSFGCAFELITDLTVYDPVYDTSYVDYCEFEQFIRVIDNTPFSFPSLWKGDTIILPNIDTATLLTFNDTLVYNPGGNALCDSFHTTYLTIHPTYDSIYSAEICDNETYTLLDGSIVDSTGIYPVNIPTSIYGCDSFITLDLTVHPTYDSTFHTSICDIDSFLLPNGVYIDTSAFVTFSDTSINGCDSIFRINLTVLLTYYDSVEYTICDNEFHILPSGDTARNQGNYIDTLVTNLGCDSVVYTTLLHDSTYSDTIVVNICDNQSHTLQNNAVVDTSGYYPVLLSTANGCDSLVTTELIVNPTYTTVIDTAICQGETYLLPNGFIVFFPGSFSSILTSTLGCDSNVITNLSIIPTKFTNLNISICDNETHTLPQGQVVNTSGTYIDTLTTAIAGCDSIITTVLTVNPTYNTPINAEICENETYTLPLGLVVDTADVYYDTLTTVNGCDSLIVTTLSINSTFSDTVITEICENETYTLPSGAIVDSTNTYIDSLFSNKGCDSIITTILTVNPIFTTVVLDTICDNEFYIRPMNDTVYSAGTYYDTLSTVSNCDSIIETILTLYLVDYDTVNIEFCEGDFFVHILPSGTVVFGAGTYVDTIQTLNGCDSITTTYVVENPIFNDTIQAGICDDDLYLLPDSSTTNVAGIHTFNYLTVNNCDSIYNVELFVAQTYQDTINDTICNNQTYTLPLGGIVNTAGTYFDTLTSLLFCDSVIVTELIINPIYSDTIQAYICDNENHTLQDSTLVYLTGFYPVTLTSELGCDSIVTTELTVYPTFNTAITISICDNEEYVRPLNDTVNTAGIYIDTLQSVNFCDSIITTTLIINTTYIDTFNYTICDNESFTMPDLSQVTVAGIYPYNLNSQLGCDSTVYIIISVNPTYSDTLYAEICDNESYTLPNGFVVSTANTYPVVLQSSSLCDSIITTILTINPTYSDTVFVDICDNQSYILPDLSVVNTAGNHLVMYNSDLNCDSAFYTNITVYPTYNDTIFPEICDNETYILPDSTVIDTTGFFTFNYNSVSNCDSIYNVSLSINPTFQDTVFVEICDNEIHTLPDGVLVNTTDTFTSTVNSQAFCDSVVVTFLTVHPTYFDTLYATICDNELHTLPNGFQTNVPGFHPVMLQSKNMCDSLVSTFLTVNPTFNTPININICDNEYHVMPLGDTITSTGVFIDTLSTALFCDSFITTTVTVHPTFSVPLFIDICDNEWHHLPGGDSVNMNGVYIDTLASIWGCDSVITTTLTVHPTYSDTIIVEICDNETHTLQNGVIVDTVNYYPVTLNTNEGCDSVVTTNLIVHPTFSDTLNITICDNQTHTLPNGFVVSSTNQYPVMLQSKHLCDSLVVTNLLVVSTYITPNPIEICDNETYTTILGNVIDTTGTYTDTLSSVNGCDSVIVTNLLVHPTYNTPNPIEICDNEFYIRPLGDTITMAGIYTDTLNSQFGCDSVVTTSLVVHLTYNTPNPIEICDNETYTTVLGNVIDTTGTYTDTLNSKYGCDSVITTNLLVHPTYNTPILIEICDDDFYIRPLGDTITMAGVYTDTLQSIQFCDSVITTTLVVRDTFHHIFDYTICDNEWHYLPDGDSTNMMGTYLDTLPSKYGCDSAITTNVTVLPTFAITYNVDICDDETYQLLDGSIVDTTGVYDVIMTAANGCNSTITTNLTVYPLYNDTVQQIICDNQIFTLANGVQVNTAGFYTVNLFSINGCDSIVVTDLVVNPTFPDTIYDTICDNQTYTLPNGNIVNIPGTYTSNFLSGLGCDSNIITNLTVNPTHDVFIDTFACPGLFTLPDGDTTSISGIYVSNLVSKLGCDSVVTFNLAIPIYPDTVMVFLCDDATYMLPDSTIISTTGYYFQALTSSTGCDSSQIFDITVYPTFDDTLNVEICENQTYILPNGWDVNLANDYTFNYSTVNGCDSLYTINLVVNLTYDTHVNDTICSNGTFTLPDGSIVSTIGAHPVMLSSKDACDSLVTTHLYHFPIYNIIDSIDLCDNENFVLSNGVSVNVNGTYTVPYLSVNGCDSNIITVIHVIPTFTSVTNDTICENEVYTLPLGMIINTAGTYFDTLQAINGCDSVVSTVLVVNPIFSDTIDVTICGNQTHTLQNGMIVNLAAFYPVTLTSVDGCDSIVTTNLIVLPVITTIINDTICDNQMYTLPNGGMVNLTGTYIDTLTSSTGCDSILRTDLIVNPTYITDLNEDICANETFTLADGTVVNTTGLYTVLLQSDLACDSLVNVNLTVHPIYSDTIIIDRCDNETYVLANGTVINTTGFYPVTLNSVHGCDSIWTVNLQIHSTFYDTTDVVICDDSTYTLQDGSIVNTSGNYSTPFTTVWGCDSIYYTNVLVNPTYDFSQAASICDNETYTMPDGTIENIAGVYVSTLSSVDGCDSVITTTLTVYPTYNGLVIPVSICDNEEYQLQDGTLVNTTGVYPITLSSKNGCDSIVTTNLTILPTYFDSVYVEICYDEHHTLPNGWSINVSGIYDVILSTVNGCDSLIRTELLVHNFTNETDPLEDVVMCLDELEPITVDYFGYDYVWNHGVTGPTIYPTESDVYVVEFSLNGSGCIARDTIRVEVKDCALTCTVTAPTGFSPNDQDMNNTFSAIHTCDDGFEEFEMRIYNRWGNIMYLSNDPEGEWDGRYKGSDAPVAVYAYTIEFKKIGGLEQEIVKGNVSLIR